jgi:hypothetical protein
MSKQPVPASLTSISLDPVPEEHSAPQQQRQVAGTDDPPARAGKAALTLRIDPILHRDLRAAAFRQDTTIQNLILRALRKDGFKSAVPDK